ncbi:unnamed protein product [Closterium sp. NIES-65]|nr:unnamed protein product [Closterium sp. NIES-65]
MGGYYFRPGTGSGRCKWHVYLPGGGWCVTVAECVERAGTGFGSTRGYPSTPAAERGLAAVLEDLQHHRGFGAASQILLSGSSAGGQAMANLCDWLASSFLSASIRCLVDSGFFLDTRDRFASGPVAAPGGPVAALCSHLATLSGPVTAPSGRVAALRGPIAASTGPVAASTGPFTAEPPSR